MGTSTFATETARVQALINDSSSDTLTEIQAFATEAYDEVVAAHDWKWLWLESALNLQATYATGTIAWSGTTLTGSGTTWTSLTATDLEGQVGSEVFGITTITDNVTIVTSRSAPVAVAAGTAYSIFRRDYALAARMRGTPVFQVSGSDGLLPLKIVKAEEMALKAQTPLVSGTPQCVTFVGFDSSGNQKIRVWPVPVAAAGLYYKGYRQTADITGSTAFDFPKEVLSAFRWLLRSKVWHWRRNTKQELIAAQNYELTLARAIAVDAPDDGRGDEIALDPQVYADWRRGDARQYPPRPGYGGDY